MEEKRLSESQVRAVRNIANSERCVVDPLNGLIAIWDGRDKFLVYDSDIEIVTGKSLFKSSTREDVTRTPTEQEAVEELESLLALIAEDQ